MRGSCRRIPTVHPRQAAIVHGGKPSSVASRKPRPFADAPAAAAAPTHRPARLGSPRWQTRAARRFGRRAGRAPRHRRRRAPGAIGLRHDQMDAFDREHRAGDQQRADHEAKQVGHQQMRHPCGRILRACSDTMPPRPPGAYIITSTNTDPGRAARTAWRRMTASEESHQRGTQRRTEETADAADVAFRPRGRNARIEDGIVGGLIARACKLPATPENIAEIAKTDTPRP